MSEAAPLPPNPEQAPADPPRIYLASLADYNAGRLHGTWIEANQTPDDLATAGNAMLDASSEPFAEEWAIHDYEGFGPLRLSEYESLETVSQLALGIMEHGQAFAAWAASLDSSELEQPREFEDHYRGHWSSVEDYAQEMLDDLGADVTTTTPDWLQPYVRLDVEALARDLSYDLTVAEAPGGGVWIFDR